MPTSHMPSKFDVYDEDSWFFGFMSRTDATELLSNNNETGAFLVRESTTAIGDLVLSVKESDEKVSHYIINRIAEKGKPVCFKIGEQTFLSMPALLSFYILNNLDDRPLKNPAVPKDPLTNRRSFTKDYLAGVQLDSMRNSQAEQKVMPCPTLLKRALPRLAKVIQPRIPNAYDKTALTLREGDIVKVTKVDINGCWEGEVFGRKGHFPFNHIKFIEDPNE